MPTDTHSADAAALRLLRGLLLGLVLFGAAGFTLELLLMDHFESLEQAIPLAALGAAIVSGAALALRPTRLGVRTFQAVMVLFVVSGLLGLYFHYRGNVEFERELDASARGLELAWRALRGGTPALAPGGLVQLGLLGLAAVYRHPALGERGSAGA
jgi:hypothetical protein